MMMKRPMKYRKMVELHHHQRVVLLEALALFEQLLGWTAES